MISMCYLDFKRFFDKILVGFSIKKTTAGKKDEKTLPSPTPITRA
jgi:hypothetical protein